MAHAGAISGLTELEGDVPAEGDVLAGPAAGAATPVVLCAFCAGPPSGRAVSIDASTAVADTARENRTDGLRRGGAPAAWLGVADAPHTATTAATATRRPPSRRVRKRDIVGMGNLYPSSRRSDPI